MSIIESAKSFNGKMVYVFGGNDPANGILDCSSYTQEVFRQNGYSIGRTTFDQINAGFEVSKNSLKPGDLVFFQGTYNTSGPSHVGIYLGNSIFAHNSSSANGYKESSLNEPYWIEHYLTARRVADQKDVGTGGIESIFPSSPDSENEETNSKIDVKWWGQILIIIVIALVIILGVVFLVASFNLKI